MTASGHTCQRSPTKETTPTAQIKPSRVSASSGRRHGPAPRGRAIRNDVRSVYEKLHVHSKSAAVSAALRRGLIE
jgi:hypothetical protein